VAQGPLKVLSDTFKILVGLFTSADRPFWFGYLLIFLLISLILYQREKRSGVKETLSSFTRDLIGRYTSRSSRVDLKLFLANFFIYSILVYYIYDYSVTSGQFKEYLSTALGGHLPEKESAGVSPGWGWMAAFALGQIVVFDVVFYFWHRLLHTVPALWQLHKLHHSAEVLTPLTRLRQDPYATVAYLLLFDCANSAYTLGFEAVTGVHATPLMIFGVPAGWFLVYVIQHHFTHSHLWISYGWLNYIFISPSQHQIHHSYHGRHLNKNYGSIFSFTDLALGTFYNTTSEREELALGIDGVEEKRINSLSLLGILAYPIRSIFSLWSSR
jgi:sterol desaturase/sphingolipid hydroxylase (fatty acid hydroxylase superfamily)